MEDPIPTRYSLLSRLQSWDDQESWKEFFDTYWRLIYSVALKSGLNEAEAQDVVQETIISVAKDLEKFKRDPKLGSFKGWLRNLTRWRIADQLRKRGHAGQTVAHDDSAVDISQIPDPASEQLESKWEEEWQTNLLKAAIERAKHRVKEEHYQIFELYVIKQWPVLQVARMLGISVGRVYLAKFRVSAAIKNEVRLLQDKWG